MRFTYSITQQFFVFLILASIVPVLIVTLLFYQNIESKFNDKINNLLVLGTLAAQDNVRNDLETLSVSTRQAASFSIYQNFKKYLISHQVVSLENDLIRFKRIRHLDTVTAYNQQGQRFFQSGEELAPPATTKMVQRALKGETVASVEALYNPAKKSPMLMYVCASPIQDDSVAPKKILGVLFTSYSMNNNFPLKDVLKIFPHLDIRIIAKTLTGDRVLASSSPNLMSFNAPIIFDGGASLSVFKNKALSRIFRENIPHGTLRSLAFPLNNLSGATIGYMVFSYSEKEFSELKQKNMLYMTGYLLFVGLMILMASYLFNRSIIKPIDELASVSEEIAKGHLDLRVQERQNPEKIQNMLSNFNKMLTQLEEDNMLKSTFVSTLTHDLRTPLFAQKRILETLEKHPINNDTELTDMLKVVQQGNRQLIDMVNKILEAYQYEEGRIGICQETLNLHELVESCCQELRPLAEPKAILLHNRIADDLPVYADPEQLKRVFQNLISNALANIQANKEVCITATQNDDHTRICVQDNGPGIGLEMQKHLFQRYFTGHSRQKIGSGLGLFICRMILELHDGQIKVSSEPGQGTTFTLVLPNQPEKESIDV